MPPPVSFIDIDTIPFSRVVTTTEFNVANEIWFRFITASDVGFGWWAEIPGGIGLGLYSNIYESDGTTLLDNRYSGNRGHWYPLVAGTYYIKLAKFPVAAISSNFEYQADTKPLDNIAFVTGTVLISDDNTSQYPAILLEPDGNIPTFVSAIPTGEIGDALPNGYVLVHDRFGKYTSNSLILFNPDLSYNQTIIPTPFIGFPRICHSNIDFYVVFPNTGELWKVTTSGVCTLIATIPEIASWGDVDPIGMNTAGTILYFAINDSSGNILKYVLATGITTVFHTIAGFTSDDSIALTANFHPGEIIVLPDGSIVTWWNVDSNSDTKLIHVNSSGTLLNTFTFSYPDHINHLSISSLTLSTHVKVWVLIDFSSTKIGDVNLSTGIFDSFFEVDTFDSGDNFEGEDKFGPSSSCPMYTLFLDAGPVANPGSGIYQIVPGKRNDTIYVTQDPVVTQDVAIPNPFATGSLLGGNSGEKSRPSARRFGTVPES